MSIADTKRETSSSSWRRIIRPDVAVGSHVTDFKPGDEVFGGRTGAFAEYVCVRKAIALKPANLTFEQAAAGPTAAITARQGLRDHGRIQSGHKVLINGASGGAGTFAVQIAKAFGAEVTGVCGPKNVAMVRSLGAGHVVDYSREDFTRSGRRYDLLLDIAGSRSWSECQRVLTPQATFVIDRTYPLSETVEAMRYLGTGHARGKVVLTL